MVISDISFFQSHIILKLSWVSSIQFWCVLFVYEYSVVFPCSYPFESVDSFQNYKEKITKMYSYLRQKALAEEFSAAFPKGFPSLEATALKLSVKLRVALLRPFVLS